MKRVSQAPWFIVLCVSISEILLYICRSSRGVSLSLGSRARACIKRLVSLSAPAGPRAGARWPTNYLYRAVPVSCKLWSI